ncbi:MAG TPA: LysM peptidoglycan-binding domain-containing protein, partial [Mycobacteriales bacterium]|nr:LysM peptidoglycan-binding domain-containing protein [Mycobacteriales bacterium]
LGQVSAHVAAAVTPRSFRHAVEVALGATLVSGPLAAPALAAPLAPPGPAATAFAVAVGDAPAPLPSVDRPALGPALGPAPASTLRSDPPADPQRPPARRPHREPAADAGGAPAAPRTPALSTRTVVVRRGDTLWSIAARRVGGTPSNAEVARAWPRWYAANRAVIGRDPNLLHPGDRLRPPPDAR